MVSHEKIYKSNIIQTKNVTFSNICAHTYYIHIITINEKGNEFEIEQGGLWEGLWEKGKVK